MQPNLNQATPDEVWAAFWHLAAAICDEIEHGKPDLIVVLHCSGAVVWYAVQRLWQATRSQPLPHVVNARIAQSFSVGYKDYYNPGSWPNTDEDAAGHMVAWAAANESWRGAMTRRVQKAVRDSQPGYILIVDDVVGEGMTALTAFGVLWNVAPTARVRLWAGVPGYWREILGNHWLNSCYPAVASQVQQKLNWDKAGLTPKRPWLTLNYCWSELVSGLAPGGADELSSVTLNDAFPNADFLTHYMPKTQWLEFPQWICSMLDAAIARWSADPAAVPELTTEVRWHPRAYALETGELLWAQAWLQRWSTPAEFAQRCHLSLPVMEALLEQWVNYRSFVRQSGDNTVWYGRKAKAGCLVYGHHLPKPDDEILSGSFGEDDVLTPFAVEFARSEPKRAGAPTLVPVAANQGAPVRAKVLVADYGFMGYGVDCQDALFYHTLDPRPSYGEYQRTGQDKTYPGIDKVMDFAGADEVFFSHEEANLEYILDPDLPDAEKGERLAALAVSSLTSETSGQGRDGIQYLIDTISSGVETRLTPHYRDALLRLADDAPDLATARARLAQQRGLV